MAEGTAQQAVRYLEERLRQTGLDDARVVLFGSRATASGGPESDVDVVIVSSAFRDKGLFERARMTQDVELSAIRQFHLPFDILTMTPEEYSGDSLAAQFVRASAVPTPAPRGRTGRPRQS